MCPKSFPSYCLLQEKHSWAMLLDRVYFKSSSSFKTTVAVLFINVSLSKMTWQVSNMNLVLSNSNLRTSSFYLGTVNNNKRMNKVTILNSTFGKLKVLNGFNVVMSKCSITGNGWKGTLIEVSNINLQISDSMFSKHKTEGGASVLKAQGSTVVMQNVTFNENVGQFGVIQATHGSSLQISGSIFHENGYWDFFYAKSTVVLESGSMARVSDSSFTWNIASQGGCIHAYPNTVLNIESSTFSHSIAQKGGAVYCQGSYENESVANLIASDLSSSVNSWMVDPMKNSIIPSRIQCSITASNFTQNSAIQSGGSLFLFKTSTQVVGSEFRVNSAFLSGGVTIVTGGTLVIDNCYLDSNPYPTLDGGILSVHDQCSVRITNSIITGCMGYRGSCVFTENHVILSIINSTIQSKHWTNYDMFYNAFIMYFSDHSSVTISQSHFVMDYYDPCIFYLENNSNLTVTGAKFNKTGSYGDAMLMASNNVKVTFNYCLFLDTGAFTLSNNSILMFKNCLINGSNDPKDDYLVSASARSHIVLFKSNITNINPDLIIVFIHVDSSSNLTMNQSTYKNNNLTKHFEIEGNANVMIEGCHFRNNSFRYGFFYATIFTITSSKLYVKDSIFHNNHLPTHYNMRMDVIFLAYASDVNMTGTTFSHNSTKDRPNYVLHMRPLILTKSQNNYLQIDRCVFDTKAGSIRIQDVVDVNIQSSIFQVDMNIALIPFTNSSGLEFFDIETVRIADTAFNASATVRTLMRFPTAGKKFQLFTKNSTLSAQGVSMTTSEQDFLDKSKELGLIKWSSDDEGKSHMETPFASSKYKITIYWIF